MTKDNKLPYGFTLVELLIAIVVIAILASLVITSYNGIQSRAHDVTIRSDLRNIYSKLEIYKMENGVYPHDTTVRRNADDGSSTMIRDSLASINMKLSTESYDTSLANTNLLYISSNDGQQFAMLAYAKGNPTYYITEQRFKPDVYEGENVGSSYPGGYPGGIGDYLGMPYEISFYYLYTGGSEGRFRIWN